MTDNDSFMDTPATVDGISLSGANRTKLDFIYKQTGDFSKLRTVGHIIEHAGIVRRNLLQSKCFQEVNLVIDAPQDKQDSSKLVYDIILKEKSRIIGKTLLSVNENQPEASFSLTFPNLLGSGEVFNLSFAKGLSKASNFSAAFSTFPAWDIAKKLTYMVTQNNRLILRSGNLNHMYRSAQLEYRQSLLNWKYLSKIILTAQLDSSDISTSDKYLPLQQYRECGVFSGASLSSHLSSKIFDISGLICNVLLDIKMKQHRNSQMALTSSLQFRSLFWITEETEFNANFILSKHFLNKSESLPICDRFFLGGSNNIRGFESNAICLDNYGYAYGGYSFWAAGFHLYRPLPYSSGTFRDMVKMHTFLCAGELLQLQQQNESRQIRISTGIGLSISVYSAINIEFNYVIPLQFKSSDRCVHGFQFGFGVDLL